jgi:hypothetical protein
MGTKFFNVAKPNGINTHPTSANGALAAQMKSTGYQGRGAGNAAAKSLGAAGALGSLKPLGQIQHDAASNAPGPKKT